MAKNAHSSCVSVSWLLPAKVSAGAGGTRGVGFFAFGTFDSVGAKFDMHVCISSNCTGDGLSRAARRPA